MDHTSWCEIQPESGLLPSDKFQTVHCDRKLRATTSLPGFGPKTNHVQAFPGSLLVSLGSEVNQTAACCAPFSLLLLLFGWGWGTGRDVSSLSWMLCEEARDTGSEHCPAVVWDAAVRLSLAVALVIIETMPGVGWGFPAH